MNFVFIKIKNLILFYYVYCSTISAPQQFLSTCTKRKPFKMPDNTCANFSEVCIKANNEECNTLLDACHQCPPSNVTVLMLTDIWNLAKVQSNLTQNLLRNYLAAFQGESVSVSANMERRLQQLADQMYARQTKLEETRDRKIDNISIFLWIITAMNVIQFLVVLGILTMKLYCHLQKDQPRSLKKEVSIHDTSSMHLLTEFDDHKEDRFISKLDEILTQLEPLSAFEANVQCKHEEMAARIASVVEEKCHSKCIEMIGQISGEGPQPQLNEILSKISALESRSNSQYLQLSQMLDDKIDSKLYHIIGRIENKFALPNSELKFQIENVETPIELTVHDDENVIKVKQKVCAKWLDSKPNDYKIMKLKYNGNVLDDNRYLLPVMDSPNELVHCEIDETIDGSDIVVLKLQGNWRVPEMIQIHKNQRISDMKRIISNLNHSNDLTVFNEVTELKNELTIRQCKLEDYDRVKIISSEYGDLIINSIFDSKESVIIESINVESFSSLRNKVAQKLHSSPDEIILFNDNRVLNEGKHMFEVGIIHESWIKYCRLTRLEELEINSVVIGNGNLSKVLEAKHRWTKKEIIIKRYKLERDSNLKENKDFLNEMILFLKIRSHSRFVQVLGICRNEEFLYIEMEKIASGSIKDLIRKNESLSETRIARWSRQILEGLRHLHYKKIIYRNLKPSSILIDESANVKLSSFSLWRYSRGLSRYMAPEVLNNEKYGVEVDVWSVGSSLIEIGTGKAPYSEKNESEAIRKLAQSRQIKYKAHGMSEDFKSFIEGCLRNDPRERMTVEVLLDHPFIRKG